MKNLEFLKAWADGKPVQFLGVDGISWATLHQPTECSSAPTFSDYVEYRIKPNTIQVWLGLMAGGAGTFTISTWREERAKNIAANPAFIRWIMEGVEVEV